MGQKISDTGRRHRLLTRGTRSKLVTQHWWHHPPALLLQPSSQRISTGHLPHVFRREQRQQGPYLPRTDLLTECMMMCIHRLHKYSCVDCYDRKYKETRGARNTLMKEVTFKLRTKRWRIGHVKSRRKASRAQGIARGKVLRPKSAWKFLKISEHVSLKHSKWGNEC